MSIKQDKQDDINQEIYLFMGEVRSSLKHRDESLEELTDQIKELHKRQDEANRKVDGLLTKITKWEAKLGAFMFIAACLWGFFVAMKDQILTFIKG